MYPRAKALPPPSQTVTQARSVIAIDDDPGSGVWQAVSGLLAEHAEFELAKCYAFGSPARDGPKQSVFRVGQWADYVLLA